MQCDWDVDVLPLFTESNNGIPGVWCLGAHLSGCHPHPLHQRGHAQTPQPSEGLLRVRQVTWSLLSPPSKAFWVVENSISGFKLTTRSEVFSLQEDLRRPSHDEGGCAQLPRLSEDPPGATLLPSTLKKREGEEGSPQSTVVMGCVIEGGGFCLSGNWKVCKVNKRRWEARTHWMPCLLSPLFESFNGTVFCVNVQRTRLCDCYPTTFSHKHLPLKWVGLAKQYWRNAV